MRKAVHLFLVGLLFYAQVLLPGFAQSVLPGFPPGVFVNRAAIDAGFVASCTESSNFIARTSGMSDAQKGNYNTLICGMVTDGTFAKLDFYYMLAAPTSTIAGLNLISTSYPITVNGSPTFTANAGYTGTGTSTDYLATAANVSTTTNFTQNSATMGLWSLTNNANGGARSYDMGTNAGNGTNGDQYVARSAGSSTRMVARNVDATTCCETVNGYYPGLAAWTRTSSIAWQAYAQGSATAESGVDLSLPLASILVRILTVTSGGSVASANQIAVAFMGSSFTGTNHTDIYNRSHTFLVAVGCGC